MQVFATGKAMAIGMARPKLTRSISLKNIVSQQVGRVMKLTAILLLGACMSVSAKGGAQTTVSLSVKDAPLEKVIKVIEQQTDYVFFYKTSLLQEAKKVTIFAKGMPLQQVLDLCFKDQPISYFISGKNITLNLKEKEKGNEKADKNPPVDISGKITDEDGNPLAGANVKVKGSSQGVTTDINGVFILKGVDENAILEVTYVGYLPASIHVNNKTSIIASLKFDIKNLTEVTINKGYYTEARKFSTSNVTKITAKDIEAQPINNPLYALQGRVPGLEITQTSGLPGSGIVARIQGLNSLKDGNGPLYIIDGVPISTEIPTPPGLNYSPLPNSGVSTIATSITGTGNVLSYVNPGDIESIEILKDADATAIYGSRAANGAILITTKKGKIGKTVINADFQQGWSKVGHFMDVLNTSHYLKMRHEAFNNDGLTPTITNPFDPGYAPDLLFWDTTRNTNWQKELIGKTSNFTNANTSISGGTSALQYLIGANYHRETTVFPGNFSDSKGGMHLSLSNNDPNKKFHFQSSTSYSFDDNHLPMADLTGIALQLVPDAPQLYNPDGTINWAPNSNGATTFVNPLANLLYNTYQAKTYNLVTNTHLSYELIPGLTISGNGGYTNLRQDNMTFLSLLAYAPDNRSGRERTAIYGSSKVNTWILEPQLNYKKNIAKGRLDVLLGSTFQSTLSQSNYLAGGGYANDALMQNPKAASHYNVTGALSNLYKYNAIYARGNYIFSDKYILNVTGRRDGSSRFGNNNKFHNFWSVGAGWIFTNERFLSIPNILSFGKLKGNFGTTGNDQIGDYQYLTLYNPVSYTFPYQGTSGLTPLGLPNPYLQWEETKKLTVGIELGFVRDRIFFSATYNRNRSSNQLVNYALPRITGSSAIIENFPATIQNKDFEFVLNSENIKQKNISWNTNFNLTIPRNKLVAFPNLSTSSYSQNYIIGQPITIQKLFHYIGVDPSTGLYVVADNKGNPTNSPNFLTDRTVIISQSAKVYGGLQNTVQYKNIELSFLFQFIKQVGPSPRLGFGFSPGKYYSYAAIGNQPSSVLNNPWQSAGDVASTQKFTTSSSQVDNALSTTFSSDASYEDASFVRLKNLSLSWQLPSQWIHKARLESLRLYLLGQNILTITKYKGLDPEVQGNQTLPPLRVITMGVQVKL
jgi:TonB-linked SusC/RagA family outer membrane protein